LRWCIYRRSLLGLRRRLRNLLAMGPLPRPVDQRLLLTKYNAELAGKLMPQEEKNIPKAGDFDGHTA
jgi:hypothetical protein